MTERTDQLHHDNAPAHSTPLVCGFLFFYEASHQPGLSASQQSRFDFLRLLAFLSAKIAVERVEICECDVHTVHKLSTSHCQLTSPTGEDCSRMHSKVSSGWLPSYIEVTRPVLEIFKMARYFPDRPRTCYSQEFFLVKLVQVFLT